MEYVRCMIGRRYVLAKCGDGFLINIFFSVIVRCEVEITVTCKWKMIVYGSEIFFG